MARLLRLVLSLVSLASAAAQAAPPPGQIKLGPVDNTCMNALGGVKDGAPIGLWGCKEDTGPNSKFTFDGAKITVGGLCLASPKGRYVIAKPCGAGDLSFKIDGKLIKTPDNKCLDAEEGKTKWGTKVVIWPCHGDGNQRWEVPSAPASQQIAAVRGDNMCMNALGGVKEGAPIGLWGCQADSGPNSQLSYDKDGHILVGGLCLASPKGRYVIATACGNKGVLTFTSSGKLLKAPGNLCLDEEEGKSATGTKIVIWQCHGDTNQQWNYAPGLPIEKAAPPPAPAAPPPPPAAAPPPPAPVAAAIAPPPAAPPPPAAEGNSSRMIKTNKRSYKKGEPVVVNYFGMTGSTTDWTNVVTADTATDEWGDWAYNGGANGERTVKNLKPGNYEARAYFNGSTSLEDKVAFTVTP